MIDFLSPLIDLIVGVANSKVGGAFAAIAATVTALWGALRGIRWIIRWLGGRDVDSRVDLIHDSVEKLASQVAIGQASKPSRDFGTEDLTQAAQRIESAITDLARRTDERSTAALEELQRGHTAAAERVFEEVLQTSGTGEAKEKAKAARHLAAFRRRRSPAEAAELYKQAASLDPSNSQNWIDFAETTLTAGRPLSDARHALMTAVEVAKEKQDEWTVISAKTCLGDVFREEGKLYLAEQSYREATDIIERLSRGLDQTDPKNARYVDALSRLWGRIAAVLLDQGESGDAFTRAHAAMALADVAAKSDPNNLDYQNNLASLWTVLAEVLHDQDELNEALYHYVKALSIRRKLNEIDDNNGEWQRKTVQLLLRIANIWISQSTEGPLGYWCLREEMEYGIDFAEDYAAEAQSLARALVRSDPNWVDQRNLARSCWWYGRILIARGEHTQALVEFRDAQKIMRQASENAPRRLPDETGESQWERDFLQLEYDMDVATKEVERLHRR